MKTIIAALVVVLFISCSGNNSAVSKKLSGCDSLVITFTMPNYDSVLTMQVTTEKKAIRKLVGFLDGKQTAVSDCGFDGHMIFYKNGQQVMPVVFKFSEDTCRYFLYTPENEAITTRISNEGVDFLKSLKEGRMWY